MKTDSLAVTPSHPLVKGFEPEVTTKAKPEPLALISARKAIRQSPELQHAFDKTKTSEEMSQTLVALGVDSEVAQYLADEYSQLELGVYIIDHESGKVLAILDEKVLEEYKEGSSLLRIQPEVEATVLCATQEASNERKNLQRFLDKGFSPDCLSLVTRKGRRGIEQRVAGYTPLQLLGRMQGAGARFFSYFDPYRTLMEENYTNYTITAWSKLGIQDPGGFNVFYHREAALTKVIPQGWMRGIASEISRKAHKHNPPSTSLAVQDLGVKDLKGASYWVVPPHQMTPFLELGVEAFPVDGALPTGFKGGIVGSLLFPSSFTLSSIELGGSCELRATLDYKAVIYDWKDFVCLDLIGSGDRPSLV